jgi:hypothetical protein
MTKKREGNFSVYPRERGDTISHWYSGKDENDNYNTLTFEGTVYKYEM